MLVDSKRFLHAYALNNGLCRATVGENTRFKRGSVVEKDQREKPPQRGCRRCERRAVPRRLFRFRSGCRDVETDGNDYEQHKRIHVEATLSLRPKAIPTPIAVTRRSIWQSIARDEPVIDVNPVHLLLQLPGRFRVEGGASPTARVGLEQDDAR